MANIVDYLEWRGDLSFEQSGFNEVDNLLLSTMSFIDLSEIVASEPFGMPVKLDYCERIYREKYPNGRYYGLTIPAVIGTIFRKAARSTRFKDIYLTYYRSELDEEEGKQFGAVTLVLPDNSIFISFRGTDDTITGWKEDFQLSYTCPVPAQQSALDYLEAVASFHRGAIRLGGHSKGGNLSVYAAAMCSPETKKRIINAYSNDGPGFTTEFISSIEFKSVEKRVVTYVPQSSVVGMLLAHNEEYQVIESTNQTGLFQHDPLSWKVLGPSFVHLDSLSKEGLKNKESLKKLLDGMDNEHRRRFTDVLFQIIEATEAKTLTELSDAKLKNVLIMLKAYNDLEKDEKEELRGFIRSLVSVESEFRVREA